MKYLDLGVETVYVALSMYMLVSCRYSLMRLPICSELEHRLHKLGINLTIFGKIFDNVLKSSIKHALLIFHACAPLIFLFILYFAFFSCFSGNSILFRHLMPLQK